MRGLIHCILFALVLSGMACAQQEDGDGSSPLSLAASNDGRTLFIADQAGKRVVAFSISSSKITGSVALTEKPNGLVVSPDNRLLYVTMDSAEGWIFVINTGTNAIQARWRAGHTPCSPVLSPDGKILYVCNRFDNDVAVLDATSGLEMARVGVSREPVAASLTPDGETLFAANFLPAGPSVGDYAGAGISAIDVKSKQSDLVSLANGSSSVHGICVSPDGGFAYAVHIFGRYKLPAFQVEHGWMNTAALSIIDAATRKVLNTVLLDDEYLGAANPWGIACSKDGRLLCVTHAGSHEVSVIDRAALHAKLDRLAKEKKSRGTDGNLVDDLSFLTGIRRRIPLAGKGPRGIALIENTAYIAEYFSDSIGIIDLLPGSKSRSIALGVRAPMSKERKGEMIFHDATYCLQHWQSCSSCHPDARADGLNWDLLNDGNGNPKNVKSLIFAHRTSPAMWMGVRENAESAVRSGFQYIEFATVSEEDAQAVDAYLKSLKPVPGPIATNPVFCDSIAKGKKVFEETECGRCHSGEYFTDGKAHNVGTGTGLDAGKAVVTPSLLECWRTAPYLHDGRDASLANVIQVHGDVENLSPEEQRDLVNYLLSL